MCDKDISLFSFAKPTQLDHRGSSLITLGRTGRAPEDPGSHLGVTHPHAISGKRIMDLLILAEKLEPRCQVQSLAMHLGNHIANLCSTSGLSSACSSLLLARVNAKVQLKECEGWRASLRDCYCNQKTARVGVPKPFEEMPAWTHVSNYHMQS